MQRELHLAQLKHLLDETTPVLHALTAESTERLYTKSGLCNGSTPAIGAHHFFKMEVLRVVSAMMESTTFFTKT